MRTRNWKWFIIEDGEFWEFGVAVEGGPMAGMPSETIASIRKNAFFHWRIWRVADDEGHEKSLEEAQRQVEEIAAPFLAPHMSGEALELAQIGYRAYKNLLGDQGVMGVELWDDLPPVVRRAWAMAGLVIMAEAETQLSK